MVFHLAIKKQNITNEKAQEVILDFSFLGEGNFTAQILKDGPNADRVGTNYLLETKQITNTSKLTVQMVGGGCFEIKIY